MNLDQLTLDVEQKIDVNAAVGAVFEGLMHRLTDKNSGAGNQPMPMVLERWPGGRWFRDLGNGDGHLWGFVQVIKPPNLLELTGPTFMSYPAAGHLQFRLTQVSGGTQLTLRHRALGLIEESHREGLSTGWQHMLTNIKSDCE